jgi:protein gp37
VNRTSIEWTDFSANPLKYRTAAAEVLWGCSKVSAGCTHCYSEALAHRYRRGGPFNDAQMAALTPFLDEAELRRMLTYKPAAGKRCFVGDMTDVFGEWVHDEQLDRLFAAFALRGSVTWQVVTKRPERMRAYLAASDLRERLATAALTLANYFDGRPEGGLLQEAFMLEEMWGKGLLWPLPNVWLGTSVENQATADERIPHLLETPAAVRFISAEPLLGPVTLHRRWLMGGTVEHGKPFVENGGVVEWQHPLDWVIVGGESGAGSRPCDSWWVESIVDDCRAAGMPVFVKQLGSHILSPNDVGFEGDTERGWPMDTTYETTTPQNWQGDDVRVRLKSRKGNEPAEWPTALRWRQFPEVSA